MEYTWLDVPITGEALLDLLLTSQGNLLCKILISDSLGCHDHSSVILLSMLKVSIKTNILHLEEQTSLCSEPTGRNAIEDKEASECWEFFTNSLLETLNQFILFKVRKEAEQETSLA